MCLLGDRGLSFAVEPTARFGKMGLRGAEAWERLEEIWSLLSGAESQAEGSVLMEKEK